MNWSVGTETLVHTNGLGRPSPRAVMGAVVVLYGLSLPVTKLISAPPLAAVTVRLWITAPLLLVAARLSGRRLTKEVLRRTALAGSLTGVNMLLVFVAIGHASIAVVAVIQALQPGVVIVVAGRWLDERSSRWHVAWTVVATAGVAVVVTGGDPAVRGDGLGIAAGISAMLAFVAYYVMNRHFRSHGMDALLWMTGATLFAAITVTPFALFLGSADDFHQIGGRDWLCLAYLVVGIGMVAHTSMSWVHQHLPAARSSLYLLGLNVVAIGAAWPILGEPVTPVQVVGGTIVLVAVTAVIARPSAVPIALATEPVPTI